MKKEDTSRQYLQVLSASSSKIDDRLSRLLSVLEGTDYKVLDSFKPYTTPKRNIEKLNKFYTLYTTTVKTIGDIRMDLSRTALKDGKPERVLGLKELLDTGVLEKISKIHDMERQMLEFKSVKMVGAYLSDTGKYVDELVSTIKASFFQSLGRLPRVPELAPEFAAFLLENCDNREFLGEYTKSAYGHLCLVNTKVNPTTLLQQTRNLSKYFNLIIQVNGEILGREAAHNINVGLITLIVLNLKKSIGDLLIQIDANNDPKNIPFLVRLRKQLKHSPGPKIKELEGLFVFKPQIDKLILNCFIQFFANLELLKTPNDSCRPEKICQTMSEILHAFSKATRVREIWVSTYGPSFGVYHADDLGTNFSNKCLMKIQKFAERMDGTARYIYLINNQHLFRKYSKGNGKMSMKELIHHNARFILGLWKIEMEKASSISELNNFLENQISTQANYALPHSTSKKITEELGDMVNTMIAERGWPDVSRSNSNGLLGLYK